MNSKLMTIAISTTLLITSGTTALATPYKTTSNQVVVTELAPRTKYTVQTTNLRERNSTRTITTNGCGQALISNGTSYKRLIINNQTIITSSLPTQTHQRCTSRRNTHTTITNTTTTTKQQLNK
ncbi:hypothetical protein H6F77_13510 [Microcoleus sp. FACHB-831]|uniref:hypothetical protein n=1 Tax=Microcoleus sp. FACHB-831 TaxID=2692827 RepID=UPI00168A0F9F|nr:hypothetical protein [Microcoleus sp. FACHB-831]MBD1922100.1 hypothetical protein [Microcoleus sp. FACHB-831]